MPPTAVDFNHLRELLLDRRNSILEQLHHEKTLHALDGTHIPVDSAEHAADSYDQDMLAYITDARSRELADIDTALMKIEEQNYGLCTDCGKPIAPRRLRAVPAASLCVACQEQLDAQRTGHTTDNRWGKVSDEHLAAIFQT